MPVLYDLTCKGSGTLLVRLYKDAGTPANECSLSEFWRAVKLLQLGRFTWFKKPGILIQALPSWWNRHLKDLGRLNTLKSAPTLPLKSTILTQLTEVWTNLVKICMLLQTSLWKNYLLWGVWIMWNMDLYFLPIGVYGKSRLFKWLWICTKSSNSVIDHSLGESKVLF